MCNQASSTTLLAVYVDLMFSCLRTESEGLVERWKSFIAAEVQCNCISIVLTDTVLSRVRTEEISYVFLVPYVNL